MPYRVSLVFVLVVSLERKRKTSKNKMKLFMKADHPRTKRNVSCQSCHGFKNMNDFVGNMQLVKRS